MFDPGSYPMGQSEAAWVNYIHELPEEELKQTLKSGDGKVCKLAMEWLVKHPEELSADLTFVGKFIRCLPLEYAQDERLLAILGNIRDHGVTHYVSRNPFSWGEKRLQPEIEKTLDHCILSENMEMAKALMANGFKTNHPEVLLHYACSTNDVGLAFELFKRHVKPSHSDLLTLACMALKNGDAKVLTQCLMYISIQMEYDKDGSFKKAMAGFNLDGASFIHHFCSNNFNLENGLYSSIFKRILRCGIGDAVDSEGNTPLHIALEKGSVRMAFHLLDSNVKVDVANSAGVTPLHLAASKDQPGVVSKLIGKGADPYAMNDEGKTPLHHALSQGLFDIAYTMLSNSSSPAAKTSMAPFQMHESLLVKSDELVMLSCTYGHYDLLSLLLDHGADLHKKNSAGWAPFDLACAGKFESISLMLLDRGIQVNEMRRKGRKPLDLALAGGLDRLAQKLIEKGAHVLTESSVQPFVYGLINNSKFAEEYFKDFTGFFRPAQSALSQEGSDKLLLKECREAVERWLSSNPACSKGRCAIEVPLLLGMNDIVQREYKKLDQAGRQEAISVLKERYPAFNTTNFQWELNPAHYSQGAVLSDKPPEDIPGLSVTQRISDATKSHPDLKLKITQMLNKIEQKERIMGLGEKSDAEVSEWYGQFERYLKHVITAYHLGDEGGDDEMKRQVLVNLALMQENCCPRWDQEVRQMYQFRPREENGSASVQEMPTVKDRVLQQLRNIRLDIVATKMIKFGIGNVHEPNYLINTFSEPLGLRVDHIEDKYADPAVFDEHHPLEEDLQVFQNNYTPHKIIELLKENFVGRQKAIATLNSLDTLANESARAGVVLKDIQDQADQLGIVLKGRTIKEIHEELKERVKQIKQDTQDPLIIEPQHMVVWLKENVAAEWRGDEYKALPEKVKAMRQQGAGDREVQKMLLEEFGLEWKLLNKKEAEEQVIKSLELQLKTKLNEARMFQKLPARLERVNNEIQEITTFLEKYRKADSDEERWNLIVEKKSAQGKLELQKLDSELKNFEEDFTVAGDPDAVSEMKEKSERAHLLKKALAEIDLRKTSEERMQLLQGAGLLPKSESLESVLTPANVKQAQINSCMHQVFDEKGRITLFAVEQLLLSTGVLSPVS